MLDDIYVNVDPTEKECILQFQSEGRNVSDYKISVDNAVGLRDELTMFIENQRSIKISVVSELFEEELQLIKSDEIRNLVKEVMDELPLDPFLYKGASSSGKYHPAECRGVGGLTIHTKYAVQAGLVLIDQDTNLDDCMVENAYDLIIGALLLHDGFKYGLTGAEQHTDPNHPNLIADYLDQKSTASETGSDRQFYLRKLSELTRSHHGKWGDTPANNRMKEYVHIADMIASRAHLIRFNPK